MSKMFVVLFMALFIASSAAYAKDVQVGGYTKKNGTKVSGYTKKTKDPDTQKVAGYTKKNGTKVAGYTRKKASK